MGFWDLYCECKSKPQQLTNKIQQVGPTVGLPRTQVMCGAPSSFQDFFWGFAQSLKQQSSVLQSTLGHEQGNPVGSQDKGRKLLAKEQECLRPNQYSSHYKHFHVQTGPHRMVDANQTSVVFSAGKLPIWGMCWSYANSPWSLGSYPQNSCPLFEVQ